MRLYTKSNKSSNAKMFNVLADNHFALFLSFNIMDEEKKGKA